MDEFDKALRYIFVLSFLLIIVAYFAGTQNIISTTGSTLGSLGQIFTGRNPQTGAFASYPSGA